MKPQPIDTNMIYGKVPPQAKELEEAVLGAIMLEKSAFERVADIVTAESFYVDAHQRIYRAMEQLAAKGSPIDMLTLIQHLISAGDLETVGGAHSITKLTKGVVSSANIEAHANIIQRKYTQRSLIIMCGKVISDAYDDQTNVEDLVATIEQHIFTITSGMYRTDYKKLAEIVPEMLQEIDELANQTKEITGVPSGYPHLDRITLGWQPGDLVIIAARPAVGKTAFTLNLAHNAYLRGENVAYFSLEMTAKKLVKRITSMDSQIPLHFLKNGRVENHRGQLMQSAERMMNAGMYIDDSFHLTISELKAKARRMVSKHGVKLILIDYLQLMHGKREHGSNREQEISSISRGLKSLAKELNVPIIALSQLSREIEKRTDKMPQLADLRESGAIEQDADMVMFLWRPTEAQREQDADLRNRGMLKIAKFRDGALDDFVFDVHDEIQKWNIIGPLNPYKQQQQQLPSTTYDDTGGRWRKIENDEE